jgi:glutamate-1-semialdehyde aminotransferase
MAVAAANVTLDELSDGKIQKYFHESTKMLIARFEEIVEDEKVSARIQGIGGHFQVYFTDHEVIDYRSAYNTRKLEYLRFQKEMVEQKIFFWPDHLFSHGICASHRKKDLDKIVEAMDLAISKVTVIP